MSRSESHSFRQSKPKLNTKVFDLGFSFAKIHNLSAFLAVGVPLFWSFLGLYRVFVSLLPYHIL